MNVAADRVASMVFQRPTGQPWLTLTHGRITAIIRCHSTCLLPSRLHTAVELIPLGGTRGKLPGLVIGRELLVANVFTDSRRHGWPIHRSYPVYAEVIRRLQTLKLANVVTVRAICPCSTSMEYLQGYQLLDNTSEYTPAHHRSSCWADHHSVEELNQVLAEVEGLVRQLHDQGIFHTDITGFNILINQQNHWKLIDLASCLTVTALAPAWLPAGWKAWLASYFEKRQLQRYLMKPLQKRWPTARLRG